MTGNTFGDKRTLVVRIPAAPLLVYGVGESPDSDMRTLVERCVGDALHEITPHDLVAPCDLAMPDILVIRAHAMSRLRLQALLQVVRGRWLSPTVYCYALASDVEAIEAMNAGADDAVAQTAPLRVVETRLLVLARRARLLNAQLRTVFGDLVYEREARRLWCAGREICLTNRELKLFDLLFLHAGNVVGVESIRAHVWGSRSAQRSNVLTVYVRHLRAKLAGSRAIIIQNVRNSGYRLTSISAYDHAGAPPHVEDAVSGRRLDAT